ncbi:hypothetical protein BJ170DRAFT_614819 [Xylariales sp. AK1849]|nr:hypothetical protein BJ170DRAFT_614819 [Xylariales sp. AK1849]
MNSEDELNMTISIMQNTNELEKRISSGSPYSDHFQGIKLRRAEITCNTWLIQAASVHRSWATLPTISSRLGCL